MTTPSGGLERAHWEGKITVATQLSTEIRRICRSQVRAFDLVTTVEWLFGLGKLGNPGALDTHGRFPALKSLFTFDSNGYRRRGGQE
jgi:hypothetical protein